MPPAVPFWFKQRQAKAEDAGPDMVRVSGPNLKEAVLGIRKADNGMWSAFMRLSADSPDAYATPPAIETAYSAWEAAFEIYRSRVVI